MLPLFERELLVVSDECVQDDGGDWPKLVLGRRCAATRPIRADRDLPRAADATFAKRGGRFGAHNLHENLPVPIAGSSETIVIGTFFNAGVRVYDVSNPYQPQEVAYFVPGAPKLSPAGAIQLNDVYVDDRGIVFTVDRFAGGLYVLELTLIAPARPRSPGRQVAGHRSHRLPRQRQDHAHPRLLGHPGMNRAAVIVNEFGEVGIDHELVAASSEKHHPARQRLPVLRRAYRSAGDAARRCSRSAAPAK